MKIMYGRNQLLESVKNNRDMLEEERKILLNNEKILNNEIANENQKLVDLNKNKKEYKKIRRIELKRALRNILEITGTGIGILIICSILNNNIYNISEMINSIPTYFSLLFITFGNVVITIDTMSSLYDFKKEYINIYDEKEIENNIDLFSKRLSDTKENVYEINNRLNIFNERIDTISKSIETNETKNKYENIIEKPVQKIKM